MNIVPYTGIAQVTLSSKWEVWYKGVKFAELEDLKLAYERLQKLVTLDTLDSDEV